MRDDRLPRAPIVVHEDEHGRTYDMDVVLSRWELRECLGVGFDRRTLEPWVQLVQTLDWTIRIGCDDVTGEDDGV